MTAGSQTNPMPKMADAEFFEPPPAWERADTISIVCLMAAAAYTRLWNLSNPGDLVFDEIYYVGEGLAYLRGEQFTSSHPPLAKLLIAGSVLIFGDRPFSWRIPNACLGIALIAITYLLARRMFHSRLAAGLAAGIAACDGMFLVHSRIAMTDIVYLSFAALACLMLFRFVQASNFESRRRALVFIGISLGLCLGSKFLVPGVTFLLVTGFLLLSLALMPARLYAVNTASRASHRRQIAGAILLTGAISASVWLALFIPHFILGWWSGIGSIYHNYQEVIWLQQQAANAADPHASPSWSWPLLLRTFSYWYRTSANGSVTAIWAGGNPIVWWAASAAIAITAVRAVVRPTLVRAFLVTGYLSYSVVPIASRAGCTSICSCRQYTSGSSRSESCWPSAGAARRHGRNKPPSC